MLIGRFETDARIELDRGRQWSPADIAAAAAPTDPGRTPLRAGHPRPAAAIIIVKPAAVVERQRTPRIVRHPGPTVVIGKNPGADGVRPPVAGHLRIPDPAVGRTPTPLPVRRQLLMEEAEIDLDFSASRAAAQQRQPRLIGRIEAGVHQQSANRQRPPYLCFHATPRLPAFTAPRGVGTGRGVTFEQPIAIMASLLGSARSKARSNFNKRGLNPV